MNANPADPMKADMDTFSVGQTYGKRWLHGDLKDVAFFYNFNLFKDIVGKGSLK